MPGNGQARPGSETGQSAVRLDELIRERMRALDLSYREVGRRAREALGDAAGAANVHALVNTRIREFPRLRTVRALSVALEVSEWEIGAASMESLGIGYYVSPQSGRTGDSWLVVSAAPLDSETVQCIRDALPDVSPTSADDDPAEDSDRR